MHQSTQKQQHNGDYTHDYMGDYSDSTETLTQLAMHDIVDIKRSTVTLKGGHKVTRFEFISADGSTVDISAHRA